MKSITRDLRVARVYCGKIVDDRTFSSLPKPITLGEYQQTLLVPLVGIDEGFTLIQRQRDGGYTLRLTDKMCGKLRVGGQDLYLDQVASHPNARAVGVVQTPAGAAHCYEVALGEGDWGLLQFGERLEVIFQFVMPSAAILSAAALRGGAGLTASAIRGLTSVGGAATLFAGAALIGAIFYAMYAHFDAVDLEKYAEEADRSLSFKTDIEQHLPDEEIEQPPVEEVVEVVMTDLITPPAPAAERFSPTPTKASPTGEGSRKDAPPGDKGVKGMNLGPEFAKSISQTFGAGPMGDIQDQAFTGLTGGDAFSQSGMGMGGIGGSMGGGGGGGGGGPIGGIGGGGMGGGPAGGPGGGTPTVNRATAKIKPVLELAPPKVGSFCKAEDIKGVVGKKAARIRNCYERRLLANPKLSGKVVAQWKIQLDGSVKDAKVSTSTVEDDEVGRCLIRLLESSKFTTPDGGVCVVEYPFTFVSQ